MKRILTFHSFLKESDQQEDAVICTTEAVQKLKEDSDFLRSAERKGVLEEIFSFGDESAWEDGNPQVQSGFMRARVDLSEMSKDGLMLTLETADLMNLIDALDDGRYLIAPNWFSGKFTGLIFKRSSDLKPGEFLIDDDPSVSYIDSYRKKSRKKYYQEFALTISLGYNSYEELLKSFESSLKGVSDLFSNVRILCDRKATTDIPGALLKATAEKIKSVYTESVKDYFKTGEIDPELTSLKDVLAEIFKEKRNVAELFPDLSDDLMAKVMDSLSKDNEKETIERIRKGLKYKKIKDFI
jgi:hypothetical protein